MKTSSQLKNVFYRAKKVLMVDDHDFFRDLIGRLFRKRNINFRGVPTGDEAVSVARVFQPDLIILDWVLRETSGEVVARQLSVSKNATLLLVSAIMDISDRDRAMRAGADDFLTKDQLTSLLLSTVNSLPAALTQVQRVMVIDADAAHREFVRDTLTRDGICLDFLEDGRSALAVARATMPDLILIEVRLPFLNGVQIFQMLAADAATRRIPVMLMSSIPDDSGALDTLLTELTPVGHLRKPFGSEELRTRVKWALSAFCGNAMDRKSKGANLVFQRGRLVFNTSMRQVRVSGRKRSLAPKQYDLLRLLISHEGPVSNSRLMAELWPGGHDPAPLKKAIQRLRQSLSLSGNPIVAVWGGYELIG